jgi:DNA-3-methyladenine glycosylase
VPSLHHPVALTADDARRLAAPLSFVGSRYDYRERFVRELADYPIRLWGHGWSRARDPVIRGMVAGGAVTAGRIVETEAYLGPEDAASHAAFRPGSHALFYGAGGHASVYLNYGVHYCLNAITNPAGKAGCVLIRALAPVTGVATMARRRGLQPQARRLASGPGNLTRALGVTLRDNGADLTHGSLVILPPDGPRDFAIARGPRVGITRSVELPLRFGLEGHPDVSRAPARGGRGRSAR